MSEYTERLSRHYVHSACNGVTCISGDDYVIIECPFRRVTHTYCATCNRTVPLEEVKWVDSGQRISDYRTEIAASVSFWEKLRLTVLGTAYEGALQLRLDAKGNPKPGATPICARPEAVSKCPPAEDHVAVVTSTQELTSALLEVLPSRFARIRCVVRAAADGEGKPFTYTITNPDRPSEVLKELSAPVGQAISRLMQVMNPRPLHGFTVNMERLSDGKWRNLIELLEP
jgi:hypothetical protein